jgi:hypothetical protein
LELKRVDDKWKNVEQIRSDFNFLTTTLLGRLHDDPKAKERLDGIVESFEDKFVNLYSDLGNSTYLIVNSDGEYDDYDEDDNDEPCGTDFKNEIEKYVERELIKERNKEKELDLKKRNSFAFFGFLFVCLWIFSPTLLKILEKYAGM